jgi:hypothetical protein
MANYISKRGANVAPSYATTDDLPASTEVGDLVFVGGQLGIAVSASSYQTCDKTDILPILAGVSSANILNPNTYDGSSNSDFFGASVSVSMKYAIAGANKEDTDAYDNNSGVAYIFDPKTGSLLQTLANPNAYSTAQNDNFGFDSDISDSHAIVGAPGEDSAANGGVGKAYIFNASTGSLVHTLNNPDDGYYDQFGDAVSIGNTYAIVGARESGSNNTGKAWIYSVSTGSVVHTLTPGHTATENYGDSVAISDTHAIVGAPRAVPSLDQGKAYIYSTTTGNLLYTLTAPGTPTSIRFGWSVGISDTHAIVGMSEANHGKAYIYALSTGALVYTLSNPNTNSSHSGDGFGYSVDICNKWAIVAAVYEDVGVVNSGTVYVYDMTDGSLEYTFENPNLYGVLVNDRMGYTLGGRGVAISDGYAIAGIMQEDRLYGSTVTNDSGAICIFK